jgi:hypothetical protein
LNGANIQFTSLTPSTNPCTGNTTGYEYQFSFMTGEAPGSGIYLIPGTTQNNAGIILWTPPGSSTPITIIAGGQSMASGAALNPITFNAVPPASITAPIIAAGMPTTLPTPCTVGNCINNNTAGAQTYIPGWGFLMNLSNGPSSANGKWVLSCYPAEIGGGINCSWQHRSGQFGRLSWKQIN